jgi:quaternary ammonium compound-resistance protein SugE
MTGTIYLLLAALLEMGWPTGLKVASLPGYKLHGIAMAVVCMALSGAFLFLSLRTIPIGVAYAAWTGLGAAGTFLIGVLLFKDPANWMSYAGVCAIVSGVVLLKASTA